MAPFDVAAAVAAARLWPATRHTGLSLADRAGLALAGDLPDGVAVTADHAWGELKSDVRVRLIR